MLCCVPCVADVLMCTICCAPGSSIHRGAFTRAGAAAASAAAFLDEICVAKVMTKSAAPAATFALGATFSTAHWAVVPSSDKSSACPRGCGAVGYWSHLCWDCPLRPRHAPPRPLLARFGWSSVSTLSDPVALACVRAWLIECQSLLWQTKEPVI